MLGHEAAASKPHERFSTREDRVEWCAMGDILSCQLSRALSDVGAVITRPSSGNHRSNFRIFAGIYRKASIFPNWIRLNFNEWASKMFENALYQ